MFTDIANSSAIASALGDRIWAPVIQSHLEFVSRAIEENGGRVIKSMGDGTMSTFTSARAALISAGKIQQGNRDANTEPQLQLRIGMHTGDVIQTDNDFFGTVVNKAARIAALAEPDEIYVSDATQIMAGNQSEISISKLCEVALKGLPGGPIGGNAKIDGGGTGKITFIADNLLIEETEEGLNIQIVDQQGRAMFPENSKYPYQATRKAIAVMAPILNRLPNQIRITGHTSPISHNAINSAASAFIRRSKRMTVASSGAAATPERTSDNSLVMC